jgi:hypothetical protein
VGRNSNPTPPRSAKSDAVNDSKSTSVVEDKGPPKWWKTIVPCILAVVVIAAVAISTGVVYGRQNVSPSPLAPGGKCGRRHDSHVTVRACLSLHPPSARVQLRPWFRQPLSYRQRLARWTLEWCAETNSIPPIACHFQSTFNSDALKTYTKSHSNILAVPVINSTNWMTIYILLGVTVEILQCHLLKRRNVLLVWISDVVHRSHKFFELRHCNWHGRQG